jgi:hypothetical protein
MREREVLRLGKGERTRWHEDLRSRHVAKDLELPIVRSTSLVRLVAVADLLSMIGEERVP